MQEVVGSIPIASTHSVKRRRARPLVGEAVGTTKESAAVEPFATSRSDASECGRPQRRRTRTPAVTGFLPTDAG